MNPKYSLKKVNVAHFDFLFCSGQQFNSLGPQFAISFSEVRSNFLLYFSGGPGSDFGPNRDLCWQGFPADQLRKVCRRNLEQWHACLSVANQTSVYVITPCRSITLQCRADHRGGQIQTSFGSVESLRKRRGFKNSFESSCLAFETLETVGNVFYLHYLFN